MLGNLNGPTLVVILFIVLLLFGAPKLPGLAKSLGQSMRILKKEVRPENESDGAGEAADPAPGSGSTSSGDAGSTPPTTSSQNSAQPKSDSASGDGGTKS